MKTFFTVETTAYAGPELGPKDTVTVQIQRYNAAGLLTSREVLKAIVVAANNIDPDMTNEKIPRISETDLPPGCSQSPKLFQPDEDDEDPRPYHDIERVDDDEPGVDA